MAQINNDKPDLITMVKSKTGTWWFAAIVLGILVAAVFSPFIFSDKMLVCTDQMGGLDARVLMKDAQHEKGVRTIFSVPLWLTSRLGGMPSIDALFNESFYLPSVFISYVDDVPRAIGWKIILHVFLAGLFFFLMLRKGFGMNPLISITGAIFYMFSPQFISHIYPGHDAKMYVIAWVPFIIWQLKLLLEAPTILMVLLLGSGIGMCILTSHIQLTYFVMGGACLYWCMAAVQLFFVKKDRKKAITISGCFWGAVILGLTLGAIQIIPSFEYIRDAFSVRGADRGFEFASSWSLHWPEFFSLWVPEFVNTLDYYWGQNPFKLNSEYAGMIPVLLAAGAIVIKPKNPWRIFWGTIAVVTVLFALGANTPVFHIAYAIVPYVKKFRAASMIMFWFSFSTILLSMLFIKDMAAGIFQTFSEQKRKKWVKGLLIAGGACVGIALLFSMQGFVKGLFTEALADQRREQVFAANFTKNFLPFLWLWCIFTVTVLALILAHLKNKVSATLCTAVILVLGMIDIIRVDSNFIKLTSSAPYVNTDPAMTPLIEEMRTEPFRCFSLPGALPRNGAGIHGLEDVSGFHDNELHWYREFRGDQQDRNYLASLIGVNSDGQPYLRAEKLSEGNPFLNIANAKYLLVRNGSQLMTVPNRNALGRISFVPGFIVMDSSKVPDALNSSAYDYRRRVALTVTPELPAGYVPPADSAPVADAPLQAKWETYSTNYRKATFKASAPGFLRISEVYYPGWDIRIDGKVSRFYRADLAWMAVAIPAGNHSIELRPDSHYISHITPKSIAVYLALSVIWLIPAVLYFRNRRRTPHA